MPSKLLNGKELAEKILLKIKQQVFEMENPPGLAAILVGDNEASKLYLKIKEEACRKTGIFFHSYVLEENCGEEKIISVIKFLNEDSDIHGILVQLPLPAKYNANKIISAIDPKKDIDGFHPKTKFISPNVLGIIELIKSTGEKIENKKVSILSNSEKFAEPFKKLMPQNKIHYQNPDDKSSVLKDQCQTSDVLIVAVGRPFFIKPEMVKKQSILIDVGINKLKNKIVGDIDPACDKIASWRSPVPGGVGPMTVAMLLNNLLK